MTTYILFPRFEGSPERANQIYQSCYYLSEKLEGGSVLYYQDLKHSHMGEAPSFFDPVVEELYNKLASRIEGVQIDSICESNLERDVVILCWDVDYLTDASEFAASLATDDRTCRVLRVDRIKEKSSTSFLLMEAQRSADLPAVITESRRRFSSLLETMASDQTFIFGTGKTIDDVNFGELPQGANYIATNSMVLNTHFFETCRPAVIVAADPIFHAGCSKYAAEFRRALVERMRDFGCHFVFPMRDYKTYKAILPDDLHGQLIPVPIRKLSDPNFDLEESFYVKATQNVLTLFLIPLAATFGSKIYFAGFDGRPINQDEYFWAHSSDNQIDAEMQSIQAAHPGFFNIDYNDYYIDHCMELSRFIKSLSIGKFELASLTESYIPYINSIVIKDREAALGHRPDVSIIIPCYNAELIVAETIHSILREREVELEMLVINDGSTDQTLALLREFAASDSRVRVIDQPNSGVSAARNAGLDAARGRFIAFCDQDDLLMPDSLPRRIEKLGSTDAEAVFGRCRVIDHTGADLGVSIGHIRRIGFHDMIGMPFHISAVLGRAEAMRLLRFEPGLSDAEDWVFFIELARSGVEFEPLQDTVSAYRWWPGSRTKRDVDAHVRGACTHFLRFVEDRFDDRLLPEKNRVGVPAARLHREQVKRLYGLAAYYVFRNDVAGARRLVTILDQKIVNGLRPDALTNLESIAVQVFLRPKDSVELDKIIIERKAGILRALEAFDPNLHAAFCKTIRDMILASEKRILGPVATGWPKPPLDCDLAEAAQAPDRTEETLSDNAPAKASQAVVAEPSVDGADIPAGPEAIAPEGPGAPAVLFTLRRRMRAAVFLAVFAAAVAGLGASLMMGAGREILMALVLLVGVMAGYALQVIRNLLHAYSNR